MNDSTVSAKTKLSRVTGTLAYITARNKDSPGSCVLMNEVYEALMAARRRFDKSQKQDAQKKPRSFAVGKRDVLHLENSIIEKRQQGYERFLNIVLW